MGLRQNLVSRRPSRKIGYAGESRDADYRNRNRPGKRGRGEPVTVSVVVLVRIGLLGLMFVGGVLCSRLPRSPLLGALWLRRRGSVGGSGCVQFITEQIGAVTVAS